MAIYSEFMMEHFRVREVRAECLPGSGGAIEAPIPGHEHPFYHTTFIMHDSGKVLIKCFRRLFNPDGSPLLGADEKPVWHQVVEKECIPGDMIPVRANDLHTIIPLEPFFRFRCVFLSRDPVTGIPVDWDNGWDVASSGSVP